METLAKKKHKIISGNAIRQARFSEKMRTMGMKKLTLWVSGEEEEAIRKLLTERKNSEPEYLQGLGPTTGRSE